MRRVKQRFKKLSDRQKLIVLSIVFVLSVIIIIVIPSLAIFRSLNLNSSAIWDGTVANSYRSGNGSEQDPYIISNGSELAYLADQLTTNNYQNDYFTLSNDIVLNEGVFNYTTDGKIEYILNNQVYYIKEYTNDYYSDSNFTGTKVGSVNIFPSLDNFKGHFDGVSNQIAGLYVTSASRNEVALFTALSGNVSNLKVRNALLYGGDITAGIASSANDAVINSVVFDGFVVGKQSDLTKTLNITVNDKQIDYNGNTSDVIDLTNDYRFAGSNIVNTTLTGDINTGSNNPTVLINEQTVIGNNFEINLGSSIKNNVAINIIDASNGLVNLSNLKYNITYDYTIVGGIVAKANNIKIFNTVNHGDVIGAKVAGGIVAVPTGNTEIKRSYNEGNIKANNIAGGLIGKIEKATDITALDVTYNSATITSDKPGGLIGLIINNQFPVNISNSFDGSLGNNVIYQSETSTVNIDNCYHVKNNDGLALGTINGSFSNTTINNLSTENYLINNVGFNKFIDIVDFNNNNANTWQFQENQFPVLYYEDLNEAVAKIYAGTYFWDNYHNDDKVVGFNSSIAFRIEAASELVPLKKIYYYIQNSSQHLTKEELLEINNWQEYQDIVSIDNPGYYTVYVKAVSYTNDIVYLNTDKMILDKVSPTGSAVVNGVSWDNYSSNLDYIYIDKPQEMTVTADDDLSGISKVKYYNANQMMSVLELNNLDSSEWTVYSDKININKDGVNIIYVQITDKSNNVTYINTDYIILEGYTITSSFMGGNNESYDNNNLIINDQSSFTTNIEFNTSLINTVEGSKHNVITNRKLPNGTKITLIDQVKHQAYQYRTTGEEAYINGCDALNDCRDKAIYPFTLFDEVGVFDSNKQFVEKTYIEESQINEKFTIIIDFAEADVTKDYLSLKTWLELHDDTGKLLRPTMLETVKSIDVYNDKNAILTFASDYPMNEIIVNSNATTNVNISSALQYNNVNNQTIYDTSYENKHIGLLIKMVDAEGTVLSKDIMKNIIFRVDNKDYYPGNDNMVRIDLGTALTAKNTTLSIITFENNNQLNEGTYYFKINNYSSSDGNYFDSISNDTLSITANIINEKADYDFNVEMPIQNRILDKTAIETNLSFNITYDNEVKQPNVKVAFYKKSLLTAFDQNYNILDLADYTADSINQYADNVYNVLNNNWNLNLQTNQLDSGGYQLLFTLYDGNKALKTVNKYFIVK